MIWTSAISEQPILEDAIAECSNAIKNEVKGGSLGLAVAFISPQHEGHYEKVPDLITEFLDPEHIFGCSGGGGCTGRSCSAYLSASQSAT